MDSGDPHDLTAQHSGTYVRDTPGWINRHLLHPGQVDDEAVGGAPAQVTVAARSHGNFQTVGAGELDRVSDIIIVNTARNECWPSLCSGVPVKDASYLFVFSVCRENELTLQPRPELLDGTRIDLNSVGALKSMAGGCQSGCHGQGQRLFDELASALRGCGMHFG